MYDVELGIFLTLINQLEKRVAQKEQLITHLHSMNNIEVNPYIFKCDITDYYIPLMSIRTDHKEISL